MTLYFLNAWGVEQTMKQKQSPVKIQSEKKTQNSNFSSIFE